MQHFGTTLSNIVGYNMLSSFEHHVGTCWAMLDRVGRCWIKFDFCQTFRPTSANIFLRACAYENINWYSVYPRTSKRVSSNISSRTMLLKKPSRLSSLSMLLFCLSFVSALHLRPLTQLKLRLQQIFIFSTIEKPPFFCFVNKLKTIA